MKCVGIQSSARVENNYVVENEVPLASKSFSFVCSNPLIKLWNITDITAL